MDFRELINKIDSINSEAKKEPERLAFDDAINHVKDIKFTPPSASSAKFSIANNPKFKGQDINDKEVKLSLLQDALKNFPAMLFGEIAQRIKPTTDAQIELSQFVGDISNKMDPEGSHIGQLSKPERELAIAVTKAALRGMELERDPDQSEYKDDEDDRMESSLPWKKFESSVKEDDMSTGTVAVGKKGKTRRATGIDDNPYDHNEGEDQTALVNAALWNMKDVYQTLIAGESLSEDDMFSYGDLVQYLEQADMPDHYSKFWDLVVDAINKAGGFGGQGDEIMVDKNIAPQIKTLYQQFKAATAKIKGVKEDIINEMGDEETELLSGVKDEDNILIVQRGYNADDIDDDPRVIGELYASEKYSDDDIKKAIAEYLKSKNLDTNFYYDSTPNDYYEKTVDGRPFRAEVTLHWLGDMGEDMEDNVTKAAKIKGVKEGRQKDEREDMEADASDMSKEEFIKAHGEKYSHIWDRVQGQMKGDPKYDESRVNEGDNIYHSCVKSFKHAKFGEGTVLHGEHTLSESGEVSHYDAKFVREDGSQFIVRNIPVANMKECVVVEHGHPKKKKKVKEEEIVGEAHPEDYRKKTITVNKDVELAGDSIWDKEGTNPKSVHVKEIKVIYEVDTESDDPEDRDETYVSVYVEHDGPWTIYTDSGFERAISQMIGIDVKFTEQGMQDDGEASLEGSVATKDIPSDAKSVESVEQEDWFQGQNDVTLNGDEFYETFGWIGENDENIEEAEYQGRTVKLNKPMRGDVKKFKVYVKNPKGNVVKVNFGDPDMRIKKSNPKRRKSFRARHNCDSPGPKHKARYWSCKKW